MVSIILKRGREHSLLTRHPWVFSGAIDKIDGPTPQSGETVRLLDSTGKFLALAAYAPESQLRCRVWSWDETEKIDQDFFHRRLQSALNYRQKLQLEKYTDSFRLIHGEADGIPGCIVDKYANFLSCQFLSSGAVRWKEQIVTGLRELLPQIAGIYERSEAEARRREGLEPFCGSLWGELPPEELWIQENGLQLAVNLTDGHKTGYYLDQRANRRYLGEISRGAQILDCCCYSGGFGLQALKNDAAFVTFLDASEESLKLVQNNIQANKLPQDNVTLLQADIFKQLRKFRDMAQSFDIIILDPPKFADTHSRLAGACRGYKDINLTALKLLKPGGRLLTFSCSAAMTAELFAKVVGGAVKDANRKARTVRTFTQDADHPMDLAFPEGFYLTGLELIAD